MNKALDTDYFKIGALVWLNGIHKTDRERIVIFDKIPMT